LTPLVFVSRLLFFMLKRLVARRGYAEKESAITALDKK
jgi:hypothetical protein